MALFSHPLFQNPLCRAKDLGKPLPPDPHAISLCLPKWDDVGGYKKKEERVWGKLESNYPRLFFHPTVQKFFSFCEKKFAKKGESCVAFPSLQVALKAQAFLIEKKGVESRVVPFEVLDVCVVCFPDSAREAVREYWQLSGEILSSRLAEYLMNAKHKPVDGGKKARLTIRKRIGELSGEAPHNIALFPTGAAALATVHRFLQIAFPERKSVQFGFSYTDALEMQEAFGNGVHFFPKGDASDFKKLEELLQKEKVLGIFCELPGNPQMPAIDLQRLGVLAKKFTVPIVIDDTLGTFANKDAFPFADIIVSSLTKFFSGAGNVMGGALLLRPESRFSQMFVRIFKSNFEDLLWDGDAVVLEENSRNFAERMAKIKENSRIIHDFLSDHPAIYRVFTPSIKTPEETLQIEGVFAFLLYNPEKNTPEFYNTVEISKGPGFGMNFTTLCPHIQLNLFEKNELIKAAGISPYLLRISVGLEDSAVLIERLEKSLDFLA